MLRRTAAALLASTVTASLALLPGSASAHHKGSGVLVYVGGGGLSQGYERFAAASGQAVSTVDVLPADLGDYRCVVLSVTRNRFTAAELATLRDYLHDHGTLIALAEHRRGFARSVSTMNQVADAVGADVSLQPAFIDPLFHTTENIDRDRYTRDVEVVSYAATSAVAVEAHGNARSLVRTPEGTSFIAADRIRGGSFVVSGDSNVFSDSSDDGYSLHDNDVLVRNLCG